MTASAAATWIAVGKVSLLDWLALTWSLGCTSVPVRPARVAITSLAFMFELVPEPVWKTSIGKASSCSPAATAPAAAAIASARSASDDAELAVDLGGGRLDPADRVDERWLDRGAADREVLDGTLGLGPPERLAGHPDLAHAVVLDAEVVVAGHTCDGTRDALDVRPTES